MKLDNVTDHSVKAFAKTFANETFHIDKRIFRTLSVLISKPGQLTSFYFSSFKNKYIQPLKLYFAVNLLFFILTPILNTPNIQVFSFNMQSFSRSNEVYQGIVNKQIQTANVSRQIYQERFNAHLKYNQPAFVFLIIPLMALFLMLLNFKSKQTYIEHLTFSIHYLSMFLLFILCMMILFRILFYVTAWFNISNGLVGLVFVAVVILGPLLYLVLATKNYYADKFLPSILKSVGGFVGFVISLGVFTHFLFFYTILALRLGY